MDKIALKKVGLLAGKMLMEEASVSKCNGSGLWGLVTAEMDFEVEDDYWSTMKSKIQKNMRTC